MSGSSTGEEENSKEKSQHTLDKANTPSQPKPSGLGHLLRSLVRRKEEAPAPPGRTGKAHNEQQRKELTPGSSTGLERKENGESVGIGDKGIPSKSNKGKKQSRVDGRCLTCTGITYFTTVLGQHKGEGPEGGRDPNPALATCLGFKQQLSVPPPPFTTPSEIEEAAKAQLPEEEIEQASLQASKLHFIAVGTTIVTAKMAKEGSTPYSLSGMATTILAPSTINEHQAKREAAVKAAKEAKQHQEGDDKKSLTPRTEALFSNIATLFPFLASPSAFLEHTKTTASNGRTFELASEFHLI